ncbi:MAG: NUDIX hydrolase [Chloroflexota bacterium]
MYLDEIRRILSTYRKERISDERLIPSAVLILLLEKDTESHLLFTERSYEVRFHRGQVCFPGGARETSDRSLLDTALRETEEEIGVLAKDVEILGELDDTPTLSTGYVITPFVGAMPYPYDFECDQRELQQIFFVPLSFLMDGSNIKEGLPPWNRRTVTGYFYEYGGHIIWGATARIVRRFTELLRSRSASPK